MHAWIGLCITLGFPSLDLFSLGFLLALSSYFTCLEKSARSRFECIRRCEARAPAEQVL